MNLDPEVDVEDEEAVGKALGITLKHGKSHQLFSWYLLFVTSNT